MVIVLTLRPMFSLEMSTTHRQVSYLLADNWVSILKVVICSKFVPLMVCLLLFDQNHIKRRLCRLRFALASCTLLRTQRTRWKGRKLLEQLHMEIKREQMETLLAPFSRLLSLLLKKVSNELIEGWSESFSCSFTGGKQWNNKWIDRATKWRNLSPPDPITKVNGDKWSERFSCCITGRYQRNSQWSN